jgi:hypothetical protein
MAKAVDEKTGDDRLEMTAARSTNAKFLFGRLQT